MGDLSVRADRFIRQVFLKNGMTAAPPTPEKAKAMKIMERAANARREAMSRRKGY